MSVLLSRSKPIELHYINILNAPLKKIKKSYDSLSPINLPSFNTIKDNKSFDVLAKKHDLDYQQSNNKFSSTPKLTYFPYSSMSSFQQQTSNYSNCNLSIKLIEEKIEEMDLGDDMYLHDTYKSDSSNSSTKRKLSIDKQQNSLNLTLKRRSSSILCKLQEKFSKHQ